MRSALHLLDATTFSQAVSGAGRYAPSPSGDLHLGNLRTAMLAWLFARSSGRKFFMRIEDVDRSRDTGAADSQLEDLAVLGIDWDGEAVLQTDRRADHEQAITWLNDQGLVYECTCSRREILEAPSAAHAPPGAYPGTCRDRTDAERKIARELIAPRQPALRLRVPKTLNEIVFVDQILGEVVGGLDDFVLQRGDGDIAYNLAVVVDDAVMGVDQIVRGDDLAHATARQILLQQLLHKPTIPQVNYAHVPLVYGPTGARLAKRDGAVTMKQLLAQGRTADSVRAEIAETLGLVQYGDKCSMQKLLERFQNQPLKLTDWHWSGKQLP